MKTPQLIAAIVLAAGESKRMGKVNKLLVEIDGVPIIKRVIDAIRGGGVNRIYVVTGFENKRVESCLSDERLTYIYNENFNQGMGTSLAVGVREIVVDDFDGILVCLSDLPRLNSEIVELLVREFYENGENKIVVPTFRGRRGHPVIFPKRYHKSLERLKGDEGARRLIQRESVLEFESGDDSIIRDLDTLKDIQ